MSVIKRRYGPFTALLIMMLVYCLGCDTAVESGDHCAFIPEPKKEYAAYTDKTVSPGNLDSIAINGDSGNLAIYIWDKDEVRFEISNKIRSTQDESVVLERIGSEFENIINTSDIISYTFVHGGKQEKPFDAWTDASIYIPRTITSMSIRLAEGNIRIIDRIYCTLDISGEMLNTTLNSFFGQIMFRCDSGNLRIGGGNLLRGSNIRFTMGSINMSGSFSPEGESVIETGIGNIELYLPYECPVSFKCDGFVRTNDFMSSQSLYSVYVKSGMGNIVIAKQ